MQNYLYKFKKETPVAEIFDSPHQEQVALPAFYPV